MISKVFLLILIVFICLFQGCFSGIKQGYSKENIIEEEFAYEANDVSIQKPVIKIKQK